MAAQCLVIALMILMIAFGFMRAKRVKWAVATLPLVVLPLVNGVFEKVLELVNGGAFNFMTAMAEIVISVVISCIGIGVCSALLLKGKKTTIPYISVSFLFTLVLALILINHYYTAMPV